ncbi:hypothetical protein NE865_04647 [Phthorimaea operculella]|nr:hypothetical protein NE865_04647 [Phthorimaea operculella]
MGDQNMGDLTGDVDMSNSEMACDNLTILKELSNISNCVKIEDFLEAVPKAKLSSSKRVKWVPTFNCLKQNILEEMLQDMNTLWKNENIPQRLETIEKQKEKFSDVNPDQKVWRPQLADVKAQLRASDVANLKKQKVLLESYAKEYESRVDRLKKTVSAKRGYIKALQMDIQKCQKKNDDIITQIGENIENHDQVMEIISIKADTNILHSEWEEKALEHM